MRYLPVFDTEHHILSLCVVTIYVVRVTGGDQRQNLICFATSTAPSIAKPLDFSSVVHDLDEVAVTEDAVGTTA